LLERFQGKGTFIKNIKPTKLPITESGFSKSITQYAPGLYRNILKNELTQAPLEISASLRLGGEHCLLASRTDILNDEIIAFDRVYIRPEYSNSITAELLKRVDFFEKWLERENLKIAFYHEAIEAVEADTEIASILKIKKGAAVLKSTETYYDTNNNPVSVFESYYRGNRVKLTSTVNFKGRTNVKVSHHECQNRLNG
jgi:DNA-binding GntR family transcriptional regulator